MTAVLMLAIGTAVAWYVVAPLVRPGRDVEPGAGLDAVRARLVDERERVLRALRDLTLDHAMGKMSDADYDALRRGQEVRALDVLRRLDACAGGGNAAAAESRGPLDLPRGRAGSDFPRGDDATDAES